MEIRTNNKPRLIIHACQLTEKERATFDWIDWSAIDTGNDSAYFFRYKGQLYSLDEFTKYSHVEFKAQGWDGYYSDSYFSGILVKFPDQDHVIIGQYFC